MKVTKRSVVTKVEADFLNVTASNDEDPRYALRRTHIRAEGNALVEFYGSVDDWQVGDEITITIEKVER